MQVSMMNPTPRAEQDALCNYWLLVKKPAHKQVTKQENQPGNMTNPTVVPNWVQKNLAVHPTLDNDTLMQNNERINKDAILAVVANMKNMKRLLNQGFPVSCPCRIESEYGD